MSKILIHQYYQNLDRTLQYGKSRNEQSIRNHFWALLNEYARKLNYELVPEVTIMGTKGTKVRPDGIVKNLWGLDIGLWESKDEKDDIEQEINAKINKGYPLTNILFEDSKIAVLFQRGAEVARIQVRDADKMHQLLTDFIGFKSEVIYQFEEAIQKFKADIPAIVQTLRQTIAQASQLNTKFRSEQNTFFDLCKVEINPDISLDDIREMMIQHILTSDIFNKVFDDPEFHRHNTIAAELEKLINILFTYSDRKNLLHSIQHYYQAIDIAASAISDHHEKQKFLKVLYENFYKVYNPKAADRLGVVYTPNEIVAFMVKNTNFLLHQHFGKTLADKNVEILDPATGTGTFICEIIENAIPSHLLDYKFKNELHANEVSILPYYIANLNIEYTFKQKMRYYAEFPNLCFVDTLDNVSSLQYVGKQNEMFGLTSENTERIRRQNSKKISVIIGNPPYNANQLNENENNKNREYKEVDKRIKDTYIKHSTAQKTKVYDMYARFYRWAMDRLDRNGIVAMITNRSFIDSRTFDGFRKSIEEEFDYIYIIDIGGDIRSNMGQKTVGNVFGIMTGVAIMFLIKNTPIIGKNKAKIYYYALHDEATKDEKLAWLKEKTDTFQSIEFQHIQPDKNNNWINLAQESDWDTLLPVCAKDKGIQSIFDIASLGASTNRDEWVYDFSKETLLQKTVFFKDTYNHEVKRWLQYKKDTHYVDKPSDSNPVVDDFLHQQSAVKWSKMIKRDKLRKGKLMEFDARQDVVKGMYRPFTTMYMNYGYTMIDVVGQMRNFLPNKAADNKLIGFLSGTRLDFCAISTALVPNLATFSVDPAKYVALYHYDSNGNKRENINDWALAQFSDYYAGTAISKTAIFYYVYAVLHCPSYRKKYELNLKREFPRMPFYADFSKWAAWGEELMNLHIGYEAVAPFGLAQIEAALPESKPKQSSLLPIIAAEQPVAVRQTTPKTKLKADKTAGTIEIDDKTSLTGIPTTAWEYKLGNRSALEWVLDQYKEKKPSDPTIAEKFDSYRFADYKSEVITLLQKVCTVSVRTMQIIAAMRE